MAPHGKKQQLMECSRPRWEGQGVEGIEQEWDSQGRPWEKRGEGDSGSDPLGMEQDLPQAQLGPKQRWNWEDRVYKIVSLVIKCGF